MITAVATANDIRILNNYNSISFNYDFYNRFIEYTDVKETTLQGYKSHLLHFFNYLKANEIKNPTRQDIKNYKDYINQQNFTARDKKSIFKSSKTFF